MEEKTLLTFHDSNKSIGFRGSAVNEEVDTDTLLQLTAVMEIARLQILKRLDEDGYFYNA